MTLKTKMTLLPLLVLFLVPITAYAYTVNEDFNPPVDDSLGGLLDINDSVGIVNELYEEHADLSAIMELQSQGDFSTPDYPFVMTYVDGDELVVMMHGMAALVGIEYEEEEIQIALDADIPIEIIYGEFVLETSQSRINSWKQYYIDHCSPVQAGYQTVCTLYGDRLRAEGINPDSLVPTPAIIPPTPTLISSSPCDESSSSLACYYYTRYIDRCLPTSTTSRCNTYATQITTAGYALPISSGTIAPIVPATPVEKNPTNVVATLNGDTITVTWTAPSYDVEKYKVYPYEDNKRQSRTYVTAESFTYNSIEEGSDYKFKVRAYYEERQNGRSSSSYVYSNVVSVPISVPAIPDPVVPEPPVIPNIIPEVPPIAALIAVYPGDSIGYLPNPILSDEGGTGVISGIATDSQNRTGIVVSKHVVSEPYLTPNEKALLLSPQNTTLATFGEIIHPILPSRQLSDASFILVNEDVELIKNMVNTQTGLMNITSYGSSKLVENTSEVTLIGRTYDVTGNILNMNVTVRDNGNDFGILNNQILANYASIGGDSGGPIIYNNTTIVGAHVGKICELRLSTSSLFGHACTTYADAIPVFSPWENILTDLNLH